MSQIVVEMKRCMISGCDNEFKPYRSTQKYCSTDCRGPYPAEKKCPQCGYTKPVDDWHKNRSNRDGLARHCKSCRNITDVRKNLTPAEKKLAQKFNTIKCTYGFTRDVVEAHWMKQSGRCAICKEVMVFFMSEQEGKSKAFRVDHDHETGELRGLLCHHCNIALGHFRDNKELLERAIDYLEGEA